MLVDVWADRSIFRDSLYQVTYEYELYIYLANLPI